MPEKILLIHGIAMRSEDKVASYAASLNALIGDRYELVPVYWGDLGADDTYLHKVIGRHPISADGFSHMVHEAVARRFGRRRTDHRRRERAWCRDGVHRLTTVPSLDRAPERE